MYGDWRKLFTSIDDINKVTAEDVQRVARQYFTPANRTTVWLAQTPQPAGVRQAGGRTGDEAIAGAALLFLAGLACSRTEPAAPLLRRSLQPPAPPAAGAHRRPAPGRPPLRLTKI